PDVEAAPSPPVGGCGSVGGTRLAGEDRAGTPPALEGDFHREDRAEPVQQLARLGRRARTVAGRGGGGDAEQGRRAALESEGRVETDRRYGDDSVRLGEGAVDAHRAEGGGFELDRRCSLVGPGEEGDGGD